MIEIQIRDGTTLPISLEELHAIVTASFDIAVQTASKRRDPTSVSATIRWTTADRLMRAFEDAGFPLPDHARHVTHRQSVRTENGTMVRSVCGCGWTGALMFRNEYQDAIEDGRAHERAERSGA